jgi:general secretion pathway protein H
MRFHEPLGFVGFCLTWNRGNIQNIRRLVGSIQIGTSVSSPSMMSLHTTSIGDVEQDVRSHPVRSRHDRARCHERERYNAATILRRPLDRSLAAGFTLLEMLVVMTIMALVITIAVPMLGRPSNTLLLETTARDLAGALRLTRAAAIAQNIDIALDIDVDRHTFKSAAIPLQSFPPDIVAELKVAEPERVSSTHGAFRFFPDGSSTGGDVVLRLHDTEARICVNWLTGEARRSKDC